MSLWQGRSSRRLLSFPCVSGDEPDPADMCADFLKYSLREWG